MCTRITLFSLPLYPSWNGVYPINDKQRVFDASTELASGNPDSYDKKSSSSTLSQSSSAQIKSQPSSHKYNPTHAVRGATLARPEGFCLCIDNDYIEHANTSSFQKPCHAANHCVPSCIDGWMNDGHDNHWPLQKNLGLSPMQRKMKQQILAKSLLPRMVLSTRRKYPLLHRFAEQGNHLNSTYFWYHFKLPASAVGTIPWPANLTIIWSRHTHKMPMKMKRRIDSLCHGRSGNGRSNS